MKCKLMHIIHNVVKLKVIVYPEEGGWVCGYQSIDDILHLPSCNFTDLFIDLMAVILY